MNELQLILGITRNLPRIKGSGAIANKILIPFYNRKKRKKTIHNVMEFKMKLDPNECTDSAVLFYPQLSDYKELESLSRLIKPTDTLVDLGSNIGFYSLALSKMVPDGEVYAIEADPYNFSRLTENLSLNPDIENIKPLNIGISDKREVLTLGINDEGNRGGNSFLKKNSPVTVDVQCDSLNQVLNDNGVSNIGFLKIDIEGFEYKVLHHYFKNSSSDLYPRLILAEHNKSIKEVNLNELIDLFKNNGYRIIKDFGLNKLWQYHED